MKRLTILTASVYCVAVAFGQTGNSKRALTPAEQEVIIGQVRNQALSYTRQLPDYICTQKTQRMINRESFGQPRLGAEVIEEQLRG